MALGTNIITLDVSPLTKLAKSLNSTDGKRELVGAMLALTQAVWSSAVSGEVFPPMQEEVISENYFAAIWDEKSVSWQGDSTVVLDPGIAWDGAGELEEDKPPFDMKPQLLNSSKAKQMKGGQGKYLDVPFKHAPPQDGGAAARGFATTMSPTVYRIVQALPDWGRYNTSEPPVTKARVGGMSAPYTHTAATQQGMRKEPTSSGSIYRSYRRVSTNSPDDAWWHPGTQGNPIVEAVAKEAQRRINEVVAGWIADMASHPTGSY